MQLKPLNDYLSINPIITGTIVNGIYAGAKPRITEGYVLAIGPGKFDEEGNRVPIPREIQVGTKVTFIDGSLEIRPIRKDDGSKDVGCFLRAEHVVGVE